jgi:hypothetical protein
MKIAAFSLFATSLYAQLQSGPASAAGTCNVANSGQSGPVTITCGIGKEQGDQMLAILNKILVNQLDPAAVMKKLDEILRAINPNRPVKTYSCDGRWRISGVSAQAANEIDVGGDNSVFLQWWLLIDFGSIRTF